MAKGACQLGQFARGAVAQQRGKQELAGVGLGVAKPEADRAVGFRRLRQAGFGISRRAGKGLLQPLEHGDSVDLDPEDAGVASRLPIGVGDMDELVMVVNRRHAATGAVALVLTGGVGAGVVGWAGHRS